VTHTDTVPLSLSLSTHALGAAAVARQEAAAAGSGRQRRRQALGGARTGVRSAAVCGTALPLPLPSRTCQPTARISRAVLACLKP
jgi:hypothetical protein